MVGGATMVVSVKPRLWISLANRLAGESEMSGIWNNCSSRSLCGYRPL